MDRCLTVAEVAEYLGIHPVTVRRMARDGKLPGRKIGKYWRFDPDNLREYMCRQLQNEENSQWPLEETLQPVSILEIGTLRSTKNKREYAALLAQK